MAKCMNTWTLREKTNMCFPGAFLDLPALTDQDREDITHFGMKVDSEKRPNFADVIAVSFCRKASDIS